MAGKDYRIPFVDLGWQFKRNQWSLTKGFLSIGRSGNFVLGPHNQALEEELEKFCGVEHAIAVGNGSDAITFGLRALGVGPGDEVITVPHTFIATVWPIIEVGAKPVFVDVGADGNIRADLIEPAITRKTKAIVVVHLAGYPADMEAISAVAGNKSLEIIEDCAQAIGTKIGQDHVGTIGKLGTFSLHPLKNLGVLGDGGFVITNDEEVANQIRLLRNHGLENRDEMVQWGFNSRLDEIQAFVARVRLRNFYGWVRKLENIAVAYRDGLQVLEPSLSLPPVDTGGQTVLHNFVITLDRRDDLRSFLETRRIETKVHYPIPVHLQEGAQRLGYAVGDFPQAENLARTSLSLPFHPGLKMRQVHSVVRAIKSFFVT